MKETVPERKTFIIAEAGVNHNGELELARNLIDVAADAGADAVKFQTFRADRLLRRDTPKARYQEETTGTSESQYEMIRKLELDVQAHEELLRHCRSRGIRFLSSPFDLESIELLRSLGLEVFKVPSGEITNLPYLRKIAEVSQKVILSSGMATLGEIEAALAVFLECGMARDQVTILHCNTEYPTPLRDVNLRAMQTIGYAFPGIEVGYSDHTVGIEVSIAAVALGARVIEKHFTLDTTLEGPDHRASLGPEELRALVAAIRNIESALGDGIKVPSASELKNRDIARKSIVAARTILEGETFSEGNLTVKRPGSGLNPMHWDRLLGKKAARTYQTDELIDA